MASKKPGGREPPGFFAGSWKCLGSWLDAYVISFYDVYYVK